MLADEAPQVPENDSVVPTLYGESKEHPISKLATQHSKLMSKMGFLSFSGIQRVYVRHHGNYAFEVNRCEVFHFPKSRTFIVFGEMRDCGKGGLSLTESAALAVTKAGIGEIFESMASSRSLTEKALRSETCTSASITPERHSMRSSSRSGETSSASTPQRNLFLTKGGPLAKSPAKKHEEKSKKVKSDVKQKKKQSPAENKKKGNSSKAPPLTKSNNPRRAGPRENKNTSLKEQKRNLVAARIALSKMCNKRKMHPVNSSIVNGSHEASKKPRLTRSGKIGEPNSVNDGLPDDDGSDLNQREVRVVMRLSGATHGTAVRALRKAGNMIDAACDLTLE